MISCEGGHHSPQVIEGAVNIAKDCIRKGKGWVRMNRRSKRLEFRYIEESDEHEAGTEWAKTEIERKQPVVRESGKGVGALYSPAPCDAGGSGAAVTCRDSYTCETSD